VVFMLVKLTILEDVHARKDGWFFALGFQWVERADVEYYQLDTAVGGLYLGKTNKSLNKEQEEVGLLVSFLRDSHFVSPRW